MKTFRLETRNAGDVRREYCANRALSESRPVQARHNRQRRTDSPASVTGWLWLAAVALLVYVVLS